MTALGGMRDGVREVGAKLRVYYWVGLRSQRAALRRAGGDLPLLVAEAYRSDPWRTAFLLERMCYDLVLGIFRSGAVPSRLLDPPGGALPGESLVLLHAGLGMALARRLLGPLRPQAPGAAFDSALDRFAGLVADNAQPAFAPVCFEALGVIARRFFPGLHREVARRLRARGPELAAWYWHGAGRATYFLPALLHPFPGMARRGAEICRSEPSAGENRLDALSGFCFAAAMVNLPRPGLVARLLPHLAPGEVEALASGVAGALLARHHTCPEDPAVHAFLAWGQAGPARSGAGEAACGPAATGSLSESLSEPWAREVIGPCREVLERAYPRLRARGELSLLARHQPLAALLAESADPPLAAPFAGAAGAAGAEAPPLAAADSAAAAEGAATAARPVARTVPSARAAGQPGISKPAAEGRP
jgi:hypothetical protein